MNATGHPTTSVFFSQDLSSFVVYRLPAVSRVGRKNMREIKGERKLRGLCRKGRERRTETDKETEDKRHEENKRKTQIQTQEGREKKGNKEWSK
jgi:hypothetical protein